MLVESMNTNELQIEILKDIEITYKSVDRLMVAYDKLRRQGNVPKHKNFGRAYEVKSKKKNNWVFLLCKLAGRPYKGPDSIYIIAMVYYYNSAGLRVFREVPEEGETYKVIVYNGHLFKRYNERMKLGLIEPLEIVKHLFINNTYTYGKPFFKEGRKFNMEICKDGLILGEFQEEKEWLVNKTFIKNEQTRPDQEAEILAGLREEFSEHWENDGLMKAEIMSFI